MKFGKIFEFHKVPEWEQFYFNYDHLKSLIKQFKSKRRKFKLGKLCADNFTINESLVVQRELGSQCECLHTQEERTHTSDDETPHAIVQHSPSAPLVSLDDDLQTFITELDADLKKVNEFFEQHLREMVSKYETMYQSFERKVREGSEEFHRKTFKHEAHDGLDYASSWGRVFNDVYTTVSWLEGFATINHNAALKIIKKFSKNFFSEKENHVQKALKGAANRSPFAHLDEIVVLKKKIRSQFAYHFTNKDIAKA